MFKWILTGLVVYLFFRYSNQKQIPTTNDQDDKDVEYTDYEEVD